MGILILLAGIALGAAGYWLARRGRWWRRVPGAFVLLLALTGAVAGGYWTWFTHRGQPAPAQETWFRGVTYERQVLRQPQRMVVHLVRVNLREPGVELVFTPTPWTGDMPGGPLDRPLHAKTVSAFARDVDAQVAINASFFFPFRSQHPLNYYPHVGDPVQVEGLAVFDGRAYREKTEWPTFYVSETSVGFDAPDAPVRDAVSGNLYLVREGRIALPADIPQDVYPRTAIGLDKSGETLLLLVVDGKQPSYSDGATYADLAGIMVRAGAHTAINLDGGGSSTLVRQSNGFADLISSPSNFKMPWWERPVANHLGIRARPVSPK